MRTGLELDKGGAVRFLHAEAWQQRRQQLGRLGGPAAALTAYAAGENYFAILHTLEAS